ncbi:hypothetical protein, partial [Bradyrhizobium sp. ORS 285]|uniref:hypothetical protein n=1 Tax=Bradyrhizobium sp. ORS 285 TaxID=115808 RepID=UPI0005580F63
MEPELVESTSRFATVLTSMSISRPSKDSTGSSVTAVAAPAVPTTGTLSSCAPTVRSVSCGAWPAGVPVRPPSTVPTLSATPFS